ncbi:MAG: hypothetical protein LBC29_02790, partial [Propionibacteriaceae bacterium]|nr:hypothetical protein [Propionibacteriaceae bacterium]
MATVSVPIWQTAQVPWVLPENIRVSRRKLAALKSSFTTVIPPAIADLELALPATLVADLEEAAADAVRFDEYVAAAFPAGLVAPMRSVLLRAESASSSQIEHLSVSARQLSNAQL